MSLKRKIKKWLIPPGILQTIHKLNKQDDISKIEIKSNYNIDNLILLKNKHLGERCFILASGPSINKQDLTLLENEYTIAVSQFFLHPQIENIKPKYHCFAPQHEPFNNSTNKIIFDNYISNYKFPVKSYIGCTNFEFSYYNFLKNNQQYNVDAEFIDYSKGCQLDETNFQDENVWDITKNPFSPRTVIYTAIQVAYFLGFKEIYLLGVDHDYLNELYREGHHFYKEEKSFSDSEHLEQFSKERWFEEYYFRWKQYRLMKEFLISKGVKVFNATEGGMLDVFPRANYKDLFKRPNSL